MPATICHQVTSMKCAKNATGMVRKLKNWRGNHVSYDFTLLYNYDYNILQPQLCTKTMKRQSNQSKNMGKQNWRNIGLKCSGFVVLFRSQALTSFEFDARHSGSPFLSPRSDHESESCMTSNLRNLYPESHGSNNMTGQPQQPLDSAVGKFFSLSSGCSKQ